MNIDLTLLLGSAILTPILALGWLRWARPEVAHWSTGSIALQATRLPLSWILVATMVWASLPLQAPGKHPATWLALLVFATGLLAAARIDAQTQLLPDRITRALVVFGLLASLWPGWPTTLEAALAGGVIGYLLPWGLNTLWLLCKPGQPAMGRGDHALLCAVGAWMGPLAPALVLGLGAVILLPLAIWCLLARGHSPQATLPFGPGLCLAAWLAMPIL